MARYHPLLRKTLNLVNFGSLLSCVERETLVNFGSLSFLARISHISSFLFCLLWLSKKYFCDILILVYFIHCLPDKICANPKDFTLISHFLQVWALDVHQLIFSFPGEHSKNTFFRSVGSTSGVTQVAVGPSNHLFSCGVDGSIKFRQLPEKELLLHHFMWE